MFRYGGPNDRSWDTELVRHLVTLGLLRSNVGCGGTWASYFTLSTRRQDNENTRQNDPITYKYVGPPGPPWRTDQDGRFYFKIVQSPRVVSPCWDLAYSPFWMRMRNVSASNDAFAGRTFVDCPDESTLPQVRVY
jgi:hypothetical protein